MKKSKNILLSVMNVFTGIGVVTVLLGAVMLFSYLAIVKGEDGQYALTLFGKSAPAKAPTQKGAPASKSVPFFGASGVSVSSAEESACGLQNFWDFYKNDRPNDLIIGNGGMYIANGASNKIQIIDKNGNITAIDGTGSLLFPEKFNDTRGVAVDTYGTVYVADYGNNRVVIKDSNNRWSELNSTNYGGKPFKPSIIIHYSIPLSNKSGILVVNEADNKILTNKGGTLVPWALSPITAPIQGLAYTNNGAGVQNLFVSSSDAASINEVYKFDLLNGKLIKKFGKTGSGDNEFSAIRDIGAFHFQNSIYNGIWVADRDSIKVFDLEGNFKSVFRDSGANQYSNIISLFYDPVTGNLYGINASGRVLTFGIDCAILRVHKDFLPGSNPRDFEFNIVQKKPLSGTFRSGLFYLDDDPNDGGLDRTRSFNVPKSLVQDPNLPYTFNSYDITETKQPDIITSWQCDYNFGGIITPVPPAFGNVAEGRAVYGTAEANCTLFNQNKGGVLPPNGKITIKKITDPKLPNVFDFIFKGVGVPKAFSLKDDGKGSVNTKEFPDLEPGEKYTITEILAPYVPGGTSFITKVVCLDSSNKKVFEGRYTAEFILNQGETVTCTFTNTKTTPGPTTDTPKQGTGGEF